MASPTPTPVHRPRPPLDAEMLRLIHHARLAKRRRRAQRVLTRA
ncbi:hypothetical protein [Nocardioides anomalus]|nr:hypothetical protein [Nocardioides anomalus]